MEAQKTYADHQRVTNNKIEITRKNLVTGLNGHDAVSPRQIECDRFGRAAEAHYIAKQQLRPITPQDISLNLLIDCVSYHYLTLRHTWSIIWLDEDDAHNNYISSQIFKQKSDSTRDLTGDFDRKP